MARTRTIQSIESDISKVQTELSKIQDRYNVLTNQLTALRKGKHELEVKQIIEAFERSGKSLEEASHFFKSNSEKIEPNEI